MDAYVYAVIDYCHNGYVALCTDFDMAYTMATEYARSNYGEDNVEYCESIWIEKIKLNEWM